MTPLTLPKNILLEDKEKVSEAEEKLLPLSKQVVVPESELFKVEVDPMQSVFIDEDRIFMFRRIVIQNRIYRQGAVIAIRSLLNHLAESYFVGQPMAKFTSLQFKIISNGKETEMLRTGVITRNSVFRLYKTFPRPFSFLQAFLVCDDIPKSTGRLTLALMMGSAALVILMGLFAIYHSARTQVDLSERRSSFVSSVTHELKTPLTNIRMYIEMLEQGIARTPEREQDYFRILSSESTRLSSLINNVLEFSRLEKKKRFANLQEGTLEDVIHEVVEVMQEKVNQEGFMLKVEQESANAFSYDREMMIQILINLIENSMKFGRDSEEKEILVRVKAAEKQMEISVSDTGPGIARNALKKVFDDFFRVDSELVRSTRGTGIGLALVKRFANAMGGTVRASNNVRAGSTITISLPA